MIPAALSRPALSLAPLAAGGPWLGKAAFVGVFVLLLVWLMLMPERLIQSDGRGPWWANPRYWAVFVCSLQIVVYLWWG